MECFSISDSIEVFANPPSKLVLPHCISTVIQNIPSQGGVWKKSDHSESQKVLTSDHPVPLFPIDGIGVNSTHADDPPPQITDHKSSKKSSPNRFVDPFGWPFDQTVQTQAHGKVELHPFDQVDVFHPFDVDQVPQEVSPDPLFDHQLELGNNGAIALPANILATDLAAQFFVPV